MLLDRNCSTMTVNNNGEAALDLACRFGHVHVGTTSNLFLSSPQNSRSNGNTFSLEFEREFVYCKTSTFSSKLDLCISERVVYLVYM